MKHLRHIHALPVNARTRVQDYEDRRELARAWMERKGIHEVRSVYEKYEKPNAPLPEELNDANVSYLLCPRQSG